MDQNGGVDTNSMAVDEPTPPVTSNPRDILEEPAAPRRNSTDDNDPSRPRKRVAVMAQPPDIRASSEAITPESSAEASTDPSDFESPQQEALKDMEPSLGVGDDSDDRNAATEEMKTVQLREMGTKKGVSPDTGEHLDEKELHTSPHSSPNKGNDKDSTQDIVIEVEEMDATEYYSSHIRLLDTKPEPISLWGDSADVAKVLADVALQFERGESPLVELEAITTEISEFISEVEGNIETFSEAYGNNELLWSRLPHLVETLLKRTDPFETDFFDTDESVDGLHRITRFLVAYIKYSTLMIRYDISLARAVESQGFPTISRAPLRVLSSLLGPTQLYDTVASSGYSISMHLADVLRCFVEPEGFLHYWKDYTTFLFQRIPLQPKLFNFSVFSIAIPASLLRLLDTCSPEVMSQEEWSNLKHTLSIAVSDLVAFVDNELADLLESNVQVLDVKDFLQYLDHLCTLTQLAYSIDPTPQPLSIRLYQRLSDSYPDLKKRDLIILADFTTRLPLYYKMLTSNRMDFRLRGLNRMTESLVKGWRNNGSRDWYLVRFLIKNSVVEYIMGPDSHYELIRRSANISSFLIVTNTITDRLFDCLWQPALESRDPRIVQAVLAMHREMMSNMSLDMLIPLYGRVSRIPVASFDTSAQEFIAHLLEHTRTIATSRQQRENNALLVNPAPYKLLIDLMRVASENDENPALQQDAAPSDLLGFATNELTKLAAIEPTDSFRRRTFDECVQDVKDMNGRATGSNIVILAFLKNRTRYHRATSPSAAQDADYLVEEHNLPALLVGDLESFLNRCGKLHNQTRTRGLQCRLDLLNYLLCFLPECLSSGLQTRLWSCIIGNKHLSNSERDQGFRFYNAFSTAKAIHPVLDNAYRNFLPGLDPSCFSPLVLAFCRKSLDFLNPEGITDKCSSPDSQHISIEGIEQLWRIVLCAPDAALASSASTALVTFYLDSPLLKRLPQPLIESAHIQLVERCISQLVSRAQIFDSGLRDKSTEQKDLHRVKIEYDRSLELLERLVRSYKSTPTEGQTTRGTSQLEMKGTPFEMKMRWHAASGQSPVQSFEIGSLNTSEELHTLISKIVGGNKHRVIMSGQELKLLNEPFKCLKDIGVRQGSFLQVARTPGPNDENSRSSSIDIGQVIMNHFESLYRLLSLPETLSKKVWNFLRSFPPHQKVIDELTSDVSGSDIFPREKPYKLLYSLFAIRNCFDEQRVDKPDMSFIRICLRHLLESLLSGDINGFGESLETRLAVLNDILQCLKRLLKELPAAKLTLPLADTDRYMKCLLSILKYCDKLMTGAGDLPAQCCINAVHVLFESFKVNKELWIQGTRDVRLLQSLLQEYLVFDKRKNVRRAAVEAIINICLADANVNDLEPQRFTAHFWPILNDIITTESLTLSSDTSEELFSTAISVFELVGNKRTEDLDLSDIFARCFRRLQGYRPSESVGHTSKDHVVFGYTRLLRRCLSYDVHREIAVEPSLIEEIWHNLLFPPISSFPNSAIERIPCVYEETRTELYGLLIDIADDTHCYTHLLKLNKQLFPKETLGIDPPSEHKQWLRESTGLVGLQNLSNTCYLNSLMTQLFMNVGFRAFIFGLPVDANDTSRRVSYNLQGLFARMQHSFSKAIEPRDFVDSLQDFAGDAIDPTVQMDVDEFFNLVFNKLENEMPSSKWKRSFGSYYGGQLVQQVKSNECAHISERTEPYNAIQCDIKGKTSLQDSLKAYVEGEIMEGGKRPDVRCSQCSSLIWLRADNKYRCTQCDRLVDAVKRTCLKDIPDHLILHLKRFEFDLQTMHRSKINDTFDFPDVLDMKPYTIDYLSAKETGNDAGPDTDMFELVGVLVHTGTADSGHYYSYIKDRVSSTPAWYEFNDSNVREFDPNTIPSACYGGSDGLNPSGNFIDKAFSAYMLFYQRSSSLQRPKAHGPTANIASTPAGLRAEIAMENEHLLRRYCMFGGNYIDFVKQLLEIPLQDDDVPIKDRIRALNLALKTFEQIASKYKELPQWEPLVSTLRDCILGNVECCTRFLCWASTEDVITSMIVQSHFARVRQTFRTMVMETLQCLRARDSSLYFGAADQQESDPERSSIFKLCLAFNQAWHGLQWSLKPWNDFWGILGDIALLGQQEREVMLEAGILRKVLETILAEHFRTNEKVGSRSDNFGRMWKKIRNQADKVALLLSRLLEICNPFEHVYEDERSRLYRKGNKDLLPLTLQEHELLFYSPDKYGFMVFTKLLDFSGTIEAVGSIVENFLLCARSPDDDDLLEMLVATLLGGVSMEPAITASPFLRCLEVFVANSKSEKYNSEIIQKVAGEVPTIGTSGGLEHLSFFQKLFSLEAPEKALRIRLVHQIRSWAPPLLVYCEEDVRVGTEQLLDDLLFARFEELPSQLMRKAIEALSQGCFEFVQLTLAKNQQPCDEKTFESLFRVMEKVGEVYPDEEQWRKCMDELRACVERLLLEENDVDLASDWACSETASDIQEITAEGYSM